MAKTIIKFLDALSPSELKLTDLPRKPDGLYNLAFNEYGQLVKRAGYAKYNTGDAINATHKIVGMHRFYKQATTSKEFIVACNTSLYKLSETTPWGATALTGCPALTADSDTYFADFANHCYIVNGANDMMKYNMTNVRTDGITVPGAPTYNTTIDGSLTAGTYYFKYTFVDEDGYESNGGTASAAMTAAATPNDGIKINIAASGDAKIAKRRIYRTTVGGSIYYYDGEVADNSDITSPTYSSTISDADISLKSVLHTDHNAPPSAPDLVVKRLSRVNVAVDDKLYVSKNYDKTTGVRSVEYFPSTNYYPTGNGQNITGLIEQLNGLPVFTENTIERLVGTDEGNFEYSNAHQEDGCIAKRSVSNWKNYVPYLSFNGIYIFDGESASAIDISSGGRLNKYIRDNIYYTYAHLSCATCYDNKYLLCIPTGTSAVPNVTIYYDFSTGRYGIYSFAFSCFSKWDKGGDGLSLKGGSNTEGRIYKVLSGLDDDGSAITAYDDIEPLDFGTPEVYKQFYSIFIKVKSTTATTLTMNYTLDNASEITSQTKTITANTTKWYRIGLVSGGNRARAISIRPYISDKYAFEIHGLAICYDDEAFAEEKE